MFIPHLLRDDKLLISTNPALTFSKECVISLFRNMKEDNMRGLVGRDPKRRKQSASDEEDDRPSALVDQYNILCAQLKESAASDVLRGSRKRSTSSEYDEDLLLEAGGAVVPSGVRSMRSRTDSSSSEEDRAGAASLKAPRPKSGVAAFLDAEALLLEEEHLPVFDIKGLYDALPPSTNPDPGIPADRGTPVVSEVVLNGAAIYTEE
jgi:hypothetical protein